MADAALDGYRVDHNILRTQIDRLLQSWGVSPNDAAIITDALMWADLRGVDSHGMSLLPGYAAACRKTPQRAKAMATVARDGPAFALIDGHGGFGHPVARMAMTTAMAKARQFGVGMVAVRNSGHFGPAGFYTEMAAEQGLIGLATTTVTGLRVAPTGGRQARLGTDPISFAAPSADGLPFLLDMATTTVAAGKLRNKAVEGLQCPPGWVLDGEGRPSTDPMMGLTDAGFMTSLGGSAESGSYKGYGLSVMVNILSSCLSGAALITDPQRGTRESGVEIGHFFLVIDPCVFRDGDAFAQDVAALNGALRATPRADPEVPVMVAGDPERATLATRLRDGVPVAPAFREKLRRLVERSGVAWLLPEA